jgi:hypothetical protein
VEVVPIAAKGRFHKEGPRKKNEEDAKIPVISMTKFKVVYCAATNSEAPA